MNSEKTQHATILIVDDNPTNVGLLFKATLKTVKFLTVAVSTLHVTLRVKRENSNKKDV